MDKGKCDILAADEYCVFLNQFNILSGFFLNETLHSGKG